MLRSLPPTLPPVPCLSQASIVTVIHLVNSAVDTVEGEGTLPASICRWFLSSVLGCEV